jgi:methionyl-tRNA formyltransferase
MSVVFFGTPRFSVPSLVSLVDAGEDVRAVVTRPDRRRGRGGRPEPSAVPEFFVVVAFGKILPPEVLGIPEKGTINLHASLLPKYRGASPIAWAIVSGERETGLCTMMMNEGLDEGDVLLVERFDIKEDDTTESLSHRLSLAGGPLMLRTLRGLRDGALRGAPQQGEPSYAPVLKKEDGRIDWSRPALEIYNFVRGMHPWPGAFSYINGERTRLMRVRPLEGGGRPGVVRDVLRDSFTVGAGEGLVEVLEIQPQGKRPMRAGEYLKGRRLRGGAPLG